MRKLGAVVALALGVAPVIFVGCGGGGGGGPRAATATISSTVMPTATPTVTPTVSGALVIAEAVGRDANGVAVHLGETVTTEGVATVSAGVLANNKLKIFIQDDDAGIMVYHQSSADVAAYQAGQRLRVTGVIRQRDPIPDANLAVGTVLLDISQGSAVVVSAGNSLPEPQPVALATLNSHGDAYTGTLVRVADAQKVSGDWPALGSKSTSVDISDDGGVNVATLRFQRNTITSDLVAALGAAGSRAFSVVGIVVQDDTTDDGKLLSDFEIWLRGAGDIDGGA